MIMMFELNQAALLFVQLLVVCHVFAAIEIAKDDHRAVLVSRGDSVTLTCNTSEKNATLITWTNNRSIFQYSIVLNRTYSNFSLHKLKINGLPEDEGLYTCNITDRSGVNSITWSLTVSENPEEPTSSKYFLYILPPAIGFLLCCITLAVFLYRCCTRTLKHGLHEIRILSFVQYHVQLEGKVVPPQPQRFAVCRTGSTLRDSVQSVTYSVLTRRQSR